MSVTHTTPVTSVAGPGVEWAPIFGGAIAAAAISFVLLTFGAAIGLTMTSPWPNAGASAIAVAFVVGAFGIAVQAGSFAAGGYLAGRMRAVRLDSTVPEGQFRDGAHGFLVWALGVVFGAALLGLTGLSALKTTVQSTAMVAGGAASGVAAKGTENALATGPVDYAVDYLFRPAPGGAAPAGATPLGQAGSATSGNAASPTAEDRAEASRIFTQTIRNQELTARERDYLAQVVVRRTGMPDAEAQKRVDEAVNEAKNLEIKARAAADKARKAALIAGFLAAASLLLSAAAAAAGASLGGRHRDEGDVLFFGRRFW